MALWDKNDKKESNTEYLALLDENGEMVAIINPRKDVPKELLQSALAAKGLKSEFRESKSDRVELKL